MNKDHAIRLIEGENNKTINFRNRVQAALYNVEMVGQISDGHWENSSPFDHWKIPSSATGVVGTPLGKTWWCPRNYNFAARELIDAVGDRMVGIAKIALALPDADNRMISVLEEYAGTTDVEGVVQTMISRSAGGSNGEYWAKKLKEAYAALGVDNKEDFVAKFESVISGVSYTMGDLRSDLRDMTHIFAGKALETPTPSSPALVSTSGAAPLDKSGGYDDKDRMRISDIERKSGGDPVKMAALASRMAKSITDSNKALRRSRAAAALGFPELATIFKNKYIALGESVCGNKIKAVSLIEGSTIQEFPLGSWVVHHYNGGTVYGIVKKVNPESVVALYCVTRGAGGALRKKDETLVRLPKSKVSKVPANISRLLNKFR